MGLRTAVADYSIILVAVLLAFALFGPADPLDDSSIKKELTELGKTDFATNKKLEAVNTTTGWILVDTAKISKNTGNIDSNTDTVESKLSNILTDTNSIEDVQTQTVETSSVLTEAQTVFGGIQTRAFDNIIDIESDKGTTVSQKRNNVIEGGGTVTKKPSLYKIQGTAALKTDRLTEYMAGTNAQTGIGLQLSRMPNTGENVKFGAFDEETGYFYKINSTCTSVNLKRDGKVVVSVCQSNWNTNTLNGSSYKDPDNGVIVNRQEYNYSALDMNIYQSDYAWYGGGVIKNEIAMDSAGYGQTVVPVHVIDYDENVSLQKTSLPIHVNVTDSSGGEDFTVFVGGRQHSILGDYKAAARKTVLYGGSVTISSSDTWQHVLSFKQEKSLQDLNLDVVDISGNFGCSAEWALYRGTGSNVTEPFAEDVFYNQPGETSLLVNKNSSLSFTGSPEEKLADSALLIDAGQFGSGGNKNDFTRVEESIRTTIANGETVSWFIRGSGGSTCTHNSLGMTVSEDY